MQRDLLRLMVTIIAIWKYKITIAKGFFKYTNIRYGGNIETGVLFHLLTIIVYLAVINHTTTIAV